MLRHLLPNGLFVWVAGNSRHPLALLRVSAILIWLAHRVSVGIKASLDWNAGCSSFLMTSARLPANSLRSAVLAAARFLLEPVRRRLLFPRENITPRIANENQLRTLSAMERRETTANEHWTVKAVFAFVLTCLVGAEIALYSGLPILLSNWP